MSQSALEQVIHQLKDDNIRITPQRREILKYIIASKEHPTAEKIYADLHPDYPSMSVATVYNTLRLLVKLGFVDELIYGDNATHFDYAETKHFHVICRNCGKIVDVFYPNLDQIRTVAGNLTGFEITGAKIDAYGLCPDCQKVLTE